MFRFKIEYKYLKFACKLSNGGSQDGVSRSFESDHVYLLKFPNKQVG